MDVDEALARQLQVALPTEGALRQHDSIHPMTASTDLSAASSSCMHTRTHLIDLFCAREQAEEDAQAAQWHQQRDRQASGDAAERDFMTQLQSGVQTVLRV